MNPKQLKPGFSIGMNYRFWANNKIMMRMRMPVKGKHKPLHYYFENKLVQVLWYIGGTKLRGGCDISAPPTVHQASTSQIVIHGTWIALTPWNGLILLFPHYPQHPSVSHELVWMCFYPSVSTWLWFLEREEGGFPQLLIIHTGAHQTMP